ncbi:hypothetical protein RRG08_027721 [Elysia crispata]|uniref:Protein quiver n=1 Tax=Elysia crispata TaxID=231223 RepID=A0AAE1CIL3_9GAST|nr:hypothetical protein RRG08_027721 [Elysia crispata]
MEDSGCSDGGGAPRECTGVHANSSYCLKSVGTIVSGNGHFVMRSCSDKPIVNCTREHMFGDLYTVCHYHCSEVGCNSGSSLRLTRSRLSSFAWVVQAIALSLWSNIPLIKVTVWGKGETVPLSSRNKKETLSLLT